MIQFGVWAPNEQVFWDTWKDAGIVSAPYEYLAPYAGGIETNSNAWDGVVYKNGSPVPGWHTNVRVYGALEDFARAGKPQIDSEGNPLGIWLSTRASELFSLTFQEADPVSGFPEGMRSSSGVTYADSRDFSSPSNIF